MFDVHRHITKPQHITVTETRHEHRAPTDESVRLLREMEQAAKEKLISVTRLEGNTLNATWHMFNDWHADGLKAFCRFELNGAEHRMEVQIPRELRYKPDEIGARIWEEITKELAKILTIELFNQQHRDIAGMLRV